MTIDYKKQNQLKKAHQLLQAQNERNIREGKRKTRVVITRLTLSKFHIDYQTQFEGEWASFRDYTIVTDKGETIADEVAYINKEYPDCEEILQRTKKSFPIVEHPNIKFANGKEVKDIRVESYECGEFYTDRSFESMEAAVAYREAKVDFYTRNPDNYMYAAWAFFL